MRTQLQRTLRSRINAWKGRSVANRVLLAVQFTVVSLVATVLLLSLPLVYFAAITNDDARIQSTKISMSKNYGQRIQVAYRDLARFAKSSLVVNGYVDSSGRENYLIPLIREFNLSLDLKSTLHLYDANSHVFASSETLSAGLNQQVASALARQTMLTKEPALARIDVPGENEPYLALAVPVYYPPSGSIEGAIMALVKARELFPDLASETLSKGCTTLLFNGTPLLDYGCSNGYFWQSHFAAQDIPNSATQLKVVYKASRESLAENLAMATAGLGVMSVLLLIYGYMLGKKQGSALARKIRELAEVSAGIVNRGAPLRPVEWSERDEIGEFVESFNNMVSALLASQTMLEARVEERTQELKRALMKADAAVAAKSRFLATMSHEMRTPMNGMLGLARLLSESNCDESKRRQYATAILTSGKNLLALLNDVLDLSKAEADQITLSPSAISLSAAAREVVELFTPAAMEKGIALKFDDNSKDGRYALDAMRIKQIIANLVNNAVKFTDVGEVVVTVSESGRSDQTATLQIAVEDTGIGIPDNELGLLFQPFSQASDAARRTAGGTGLGLYLVKTLAGLMHGSVTVESKVGKGSRFVVNLDAPLASAVGEPVEEQAAGPADELPRFAGRVLVAEDNPVNLLVIRAFLMRLGLEVESAENGALAFEKSRQSRFDLIIMDCQMPVMDGYECARQLRVAESANGEQPIPILALTAAAFPEDRRRATDAGMDGFLSKPLIPEELYRELSRWLEKSEIGAR